MCLSLSARLLGEWSLDGSGVWTEAVGSTDIALGVACDLLVVFPIFFAVCEGSGLL